MQILTKFLLQNFTKMNIAGLWISLPFSDNNRFINSQIIPKTSKGILVFILIWFN